MPKTDNLLASLLKQPESDVLEFTTTTIRETIASKVVSFLNSQGGILIVGMSAEDGWVGISNASSLRAEMEEFLSSHIDPKAAFRTEVVEATGREGVLIEVPPGGAKPYVFAGAIYIRHKAQTKAASPSEITRLVNLRSREEERWERQAAIGMESHTLDAAQINRTFTEAVRRYEYSTGEDAAPINKLQRMDLASDVWPRNAAVVLFLSEVSKHRYTQLAARATVYQNDKRSDFVDDKIFAGNAFFLYERLFEFVSRHTSMQSTITSDDTVRKDSFAFPALVVREAILNAITHREYQDTSPIQLRIFPDRFELWNPGKIAQTIIDEPGVSRPRNPDIARVLYLRGLVEMVGVGMLRMREEMALLGLAAPQWENRSGGTQVTLPLITSDTKNNTTNYEIEARSLSERAFAYLNEAKQGERITREEYQNRYGDNVAERSARNDLKRLVTHGYLRQVGAASATAYIRTDKDALSL